MIRHEMLRQLGEASIRDIFDIIVIGGGATGLGIAVDAASRGFSVVLLEQSDFSSGTSSRSTKLVHGGVRYLQQGNVSLVVESLKERGFLLKNAPHIVQNQSFIVPSYEWWESPFYGIGLKVYDLLALRFGFGRSRILSKEEVLKHIPTLEQKELRGGVKYYDGQFDDARLAIHLAQTAADHGAILLNYCGVTSFLKDENGIIDGVECHDQISNKGYSIKAKAVVNATGPFTDHLRKLDNPDAADIISPSQGAHIVLDSSFLNGDSAIMVPHTSDGRVLFAIPWQDVTIVGTTDTPIETVTQEPVPLKQEIDFILTTANQYLARDASLEDVLSVFVGIRPLVKTGSDHAENTSLLSRDHTILIDPHSGLLTIAGGKWTTYRKMAEDVVDQVIQLASLPAASCMTEELAIHGACKVSNPDEAYSIYGTDRLRILKLIEEKPSLAKPIHPSLPITGAEIIWACQEEMAQKIDDVLSRRTRCLLYNAKASTEAADQVASLMCDYLNWDEDRKKQEIAEFQQLAEKYQCSGFIT